MVSSTALVAELETRLACWPKINRYIVAYSGGLDSHVLLHLIKSAGPSTPIIAVHVHHGLSEHADAWAEHCQKVCEKIDVPLILRKVKVTPRSRESTQIAARRERYAALQAIMKPNDCLLTAHHQDDQVETVLLRLLRGSGPKGLVGMRDLTEFGPGYLGRPLLGFSSEQLHEYAQAERLEWIEDPSNAEAKYDRNYLRHKVIPVLQKLRPNLAQAVVRTASLCEESEVLLNELAVLDLAQVINQQNRLSVVKLRTLSPERQRNVLRYWLTEQGASLPSYAQLTMAQQQLLHSAKGAKPVIKWGNYVLRGDKGDIYLHEEARSENVS